MTKPSIKGFTLSELLLASAILAFVLAGLLVLFINCIFLNEANRNLTLAVSHAQYVLEEIKDTNFINIQPNITSGVWDWDETEFATKGLTALNSEVLDTQVSGTDLLDIRVTVAWKDRGIRDRSIQLETLIAEP